MESKSTAEHVEYLIDEYESVVAEMQGPEDLERLKGLLISQCEWSERGSATIIHLATHYGSFVLANALALAEALEIEDGECGI